jgi:hypothetical protein
MGGWKAESEGDAKPKDKQVLQHVTELFITTYNVNSKADSLFFILNIYSCICICNMSYICEYVNKGRVTRRFFLFFGITKSQI